MIKDFIGAVFVSVFIIGAPIWLALAVVYEDLLFCIVFSLYTLMGYWAVYEANRRSRRRIAIAQNDKLL